MRAQVVSFHCVLKDKTGKVISSTYNHDVITAVADRMAPLKALSQGLQNLQKGEKRKIQLTAAEAYGFYDPSLVVELSRKQVPRGSALRLGDRIMADAGDGDRRLFRVIGAEADTVSLDGNHPLAGQDLTFDIEATEARDATAEEIAECDSPAPATAQLLH